MTNHKDRKENTHTTQSEIDFLDGIVHGKWVTINSDQRKLKALRGYVSRMTNRTWDVGVDVNVIHKHASKLLEMQSR